MTATRPARRLGTAALAVGTLLVLGGSAGGHQIRPGYLELRETAPGELAASWTVPARGEARLGLHPVFPPPCETDPARGAFEGDAWIERFAVRCGGGVDGLRIAIEGLPATMTDVLVRIERASGATQAVRLTPGKPTFVIEATPGRFDVARSYLGLGVEHILLGFDHLLFVLALLLLV